MKHLTLILTMLLALSACSAAAQSTDPEDSRRNEALDRGSKLITGGFSYSNAGGELYESGSGDPLRTFALNQSIGSFVVHGLSIGASYGFTRLSQGDNSIHSINAGPQVLYFIDTGTAVLPHFGGGVQMLAVGGGGQTEIGMGFDFGGGITVMTSPHLGLGFHVTYSHESFTPEGAWRSIEGSTITTGMTLIGFIH